MSKKGPEQLKKLKPRPLTLADLGSALYGIPPARPSSTPEVGIDLVSFRSLPLGTMFNNTYTHRHRSEDPKQTARGMRNMAIAATLETNSATRKESNVSLVVMTPLDQALRIISAEILTYPVYVVFYHTNLRHFERVEYSRMSVYNALHLEAGSFPSRADLEQVDQLIMAAAELRPELPHEKVNRLLQQVKIADSLIKEQKGIAAARFSPNGISGLRAGVSPSWANRDYLYNLKEENIKEYLTAVMDLLVEQPELAPLFTTSKRAAQDPNHLAIEMHMIKDRNLMARLLYRGTQPDLFNSGFQASTNINTQEINMSRKEVAMGRGLDRDITRDQIANILGL